MPRKNRIIRVVIIGGGISGIAQAIRLKEELGDNVLITILEKKGSPGGVWRDAQWPGAGVDVPIHLYSLYSDLNPNWNEKFASQPDVLAYWNDLIDSHGLRDKFLLNTAYVASEWSEATQTHTVHIHNTATGVKSDLIADVVVSAAGPLAKPVIPSIPGRESFAGDQFHNLHWDTSVNLEGKRVAVVGNGSSGIQLVPGVAAIPGVTLTHYIRSGGYFVPKIQKTYSALEKFAFRYIPGWINIYRLSLLYDHDKMWSIRTFADNAGREAQEAALLGYLREKAPAEYIDALTPHYPLGAKRTALDYGWLDSLHRPNVDLVSTRITAVTPTGIDAADGVHRKHDVIIWATGSDVPHHGLGANVGLRGEGGLELYAYWKSIGAPQSYAGIAVPKTTAIARIVRELLDYDVTSVQPTQEAYERWNKWLDERLHNCVATTDKTNNWWRVDGGRITVINPQSGVSLWLNTLATKWEDWSAVRVKEKDGKVKIEKVDVAAIKKRRRAVTAVSAVGVAAAAYWYLDAEALRSAKQFLEEAVSTYWR